MLNNLRIIKNLVHFFHVEYKYNICHNHRCIQLAVRSNGGWNLQKSEIIKQAVVEQACDTVFKVFYS